MIQVLAGQISVISVISLILKRLESQGGDALLLH